MNNWIKRSCLLLSLLVAVVGCDKSDDKAAVEKGMEVTEQDAHKQYIKENSGFLTPLAGMEDKAPKITEVISLEMVTTKGVVLLEVYPEAAPRAVSRFVELAEAGFYDGTPIFRVVKSPRPFVAQFGINWRDGFREKKQESFDDDTSYFKLESGTLAFAKAGPNTGSTQVFINYDDNSRLAEKNYGYFAAFGKVVKDMSVAESWKSVGDAAGGLDQNQLWNNGDFYLNDLKDKPDMIQSIRVIKE